MIALMGSRGRLLAWGSVLLGIGVVCLVAWAVVRGGDAGGQQPTAAAGASADPSAEPTLVLTDYELYTHCGVREAKVGDDFYLASPELGASGNPPSGWGNPSQVGTMTVYADGTARFSAAGGLEAAFVIRPGATEWISICQ
jgi:hypothetical protein